MITTIDDFLNAQEAVEKFKTDTIARFGLDLEVSCVNDYMGNSVKGFDISNNGGMFFHRITTIAEMKSFHNAFALGIEYYEKNMKDQV